MNLDFLITRSIYENENISQRDLARKFCISLGKVNQVIKECEKKKLLKDKKVTKKGIEEIKKYKVDRAVILACGKGIRLAPLTYDTPKSFIKIKGARMIERQIEQLKDVGINDIIIMVGYLKEKFDYLIDKYNVKLIYNEEYNDKNTLATLYHARNFLKNKNTYICVSDVYMEENIYHKYECEPYYTGAYYEDCKNEWRYIATAKNEIKSVAIGGKNDYCLVGPCFLTSDFSKKLIPLIEKYYNMSHTANYYWEDVLVQNFKNLPKIYVYKLRSGIIYEFDSISDIKAFDKNATDFGSAALAFVAKVLKCKESDIKDIKCVKEGMTNNSFTFILGAKKYIARIPGHGTEKFIDRNAEYETYKKLKDKNITEKVIFFDSKNGYKLSEYFEKSNIIDIGNKKDLSDTMKIYKKLHTLGVKVSASCDIIDKIHEYMDIISRKKIMIPYEDFDLMYEKEQILEKKIKSLKRVKTLCHGDANPGNVLHTKEGLKLIDFEYAGMADPLSDIALFGIYVDFDIEKTLSLLHMYEKSATKKDEWIVVSYMALGGFYSMLWALVREGTSGVSYGSYGMRMYRAFKNAYKYIESVKGE